MIFSNYRVVWGVAEEISQQDGNSSYSQPMIKKQNESWGMGGEFPPVFADYALAEKWVAHQTYPHNWKIVQLTLVLE